MHHAIIGATLTKFKQQNFGAIFNVTITSIVQDTDDTNNIDPILLWYYGHINYNK